MPTASLEYLSVVSPEAAATWANLPSLQRTLPKAGPVELAVETRPLEALRMGTYVGSCLGLGRSFSYTAAAVVLDGNKQVVFARSETGQFLARQIIGISEEWTLCCYLVYPEQNGSPLSAVFREYNEQLSRTLGIPLAGEDDDVEKLIATAVFDDGIWLAENGGPEHAKGAATPG